MRKPDVCIAAAPTVAATAPAGDAPTVHAERGQDFVRRVHEAIRRGVAWRPARYAAAGAAAAARRSPLSTAIAARERSVKTSAPTPNTPMLTMISTFVGAYS